MPKALWIKHYGARTLLEGKPTLEQAQEMVGGYVQAVKVVDPDDGKTKQLLINEEGLMMNLPTNQEATRIYRHTNLIGKIVGNAILLEGWRF